MSLKFLDFLFNRKGNLNPEIEELIDYKFANKSILSMALSHRSNSLSQVSNERLEFLGDSVLGVVVSEFIYQKFPEYSEGNLTKIKATLVNETILSKVADGFGLGEFIYLSAEEEKSGGRKKPSILADAMEALIGAVYLDGGLDASSKFIHRFILNEHERLLNLEEARNYKGELLELLQGAGKPGPYYEVIEENGPDHFKEFVISVSINGNRLGVGKGGTKKEAEQKAAKMALEQIDNYSKAKPINGNIL